MRKATVLSTALAASLALLGACDDIPVIQKKGSVDESAYQGAADTPLDDEQVRNLRQRAKLQAGSSL